MKLCTSTTRPKSPNIGDAFLETDTEFIIIWNGLAWLEINKTSESFNNSMSASFGSSGAIRIPANSDLNFSGDMTVSCWVKFNVVNAYTSLLAVRSSSDVQFNLMLSDLKKPRFYSGAISDGTTIFQAGQWYHVLVSCESGVSNGTKIYVNGALEGSSTHTITSLSNQFEISGLQAFGSYYVNGLMDEVAIWDSALTPSDVALVYNGGIPASISSLNPIGWWRMGDGGGDTNSVGGSPAVGDTIGTISDLGAGGNDGTGTNATFSSDVPKFNSFSVDFNGITQYMSVTPSSTIPMYGVSMWFNCDNIIDKNTIRGVLFNPSGTFWVFGLGGNITGGLTDEIISIYIGARYGYTSSSATIPTGWHHVVAAWSTTSATNPGNPGYDIWLDGVKVGNAIDTSGGSAALFTIPASQIRFAERNGIYPYGGLIDEISIFSSSELSASDIATLYNNGVPSDISSLNPAGWWRMGDNNSGTGTTITDQGSGGNDGTLINGPTFSSDVPS